MTEEHDETAEIVADAIAQERAAVVAWLRREMQPCSGPVRATLAFSANSIEEGKHRREETK
jgi:hypothetical protein